MAEIKSVVCDVCGKPATGTYALGERPNKPWVVDLCEEHAQPIVNLRQYARAGDGQRRPYRRLNKVTLKVEDAPNP